MLIGKLIRRSRLPGATLGGAVPWVLRPRLRVALRLLEGGLWSAALAAGGFLSYVALDRVVYEARLSSKLHQLTMTAPAFAASPITEASHGTTLQPSGPGELIGRLEIPSAGIAVMVAAGTDELTLRRGVGHIDGTALPGEPGNVGLAGHRDTVFRGLRNLRPTDRILLITANGRFEYAVDSFQTVAPERSDVLDPSPQPTLTLVTCYPFDFIGPAPLRFIVRAREIGRGCNACSPATEALQPAAADRP